MAVMDFFFFLQHTALCNEFQQAVGVGVLQTFSTCAVKPIKNKKYLYVHI